MSILAQALPARAPALEPPVLLSSLTGHAALVDRQASQAKICPENRARTVSDARCPVSCGLVSDACGPAPGACGHFSGACGPFSGACGQPLLPAWYPRVLPASTDWHHAQDRECLYFRGLPPGSPVKQIAAPNARSWVPCEKDGLSLCRLLDTARTAGGNSCAGTAAFSPIFSAPTHGPVTASGSLASCSASSFSRALFALVLLLLPLIALVLSFKTLFPRWAALRPYTSALAGHFVEQATALGCQGTLGPAISLGNKSLARQEITKGDCCQLCPQCLECATQ
ncbi:hypothetical protein K438DRAFT_1197044 [Mycena galopus ATCC 62051]|nr:hypothetical protein K438DRAFT_1197044 [Mycena galopus ATCC 62051]